MKKPYITKYANCVVARLENRRIIVSKHVTKDGIDAYRIELTNIITDRKWKTCKMKRIRGCKVITGLILSKESIPYLVACIKELETYPMYKNNELH